MTDGKRHIQQSALTLDGDPEPPKGQPEAGVGSDARSKSAADVAALLSGQDPAAHAPQERAEEIHRFGILPTEQYAEAEKFAATYLGESAGDEFRECTETNPELTVACFAQGQELIGLCFGHARNASAVGLVGIAMHPDAAAHGKGGELLRFFEQGVLAHGYTTISLGSASGYVERFYLKNGYKPTEYLVYLPAGSRPPLEGLDVLRVREVDDQVMINIRNESGYQPELKQALVECLGAKRAIYIFEKHIGS